MIMIIKTISIRLLAAGRLDMFKPIMKYLKRDD